MIELQYNTTHHCAISQMMNMMSVFFSHQIDDRFRYRKYDRVYMDLGAVS